MTILLWSIEYLNQVNLGRIYEPLTLFNSDSDSGDENSLQPLPKSVKFVVS